MKTKKFLMTSLLVMGMIIAKAANGYPPELVLVSQPVLTYNANSVTIYYDIQNIGDYTYRGDLCIYLDPDNGYCYASEYMKICAGSIRRVAVTIPAYRPNPSVLYTVMPYYELYDELYSFTTFEYFEPVRFCWYGYRNEPWVVIHVGPRPRYYHRPGEYRYYYDGYRPMLPPPPPGGWGPGGPHYIVMDPHHHTYAHHHHYGGYPANYHPSGSTPGYNPPESGDHGNSGAAVVKPNGSNTSGSMSTNSSGNNSGNNSSATINNNGGATTRPNTNANTSGNSGSTTRPSSNSSNNSGSTTRPSSNSSNNNSSTVRPNTNSSSNSNSTVRPNTNSSNSSSSGRTGNSSGSSSSSTRNASSSSNSRSNNSGTSSSSNNNSSSRGSSSSNSSSSSRGSGSTGGRR